MSDLEADLRRAIERLSKSHPEHKPALIHPAAYAQLLQDASESGRTFAEQRDYEIERAAERLLCRLDEREASS